MFRFAPVVLMVFLSLVLAVVSSFSVCLPQQSALLLSFRHQLLSSPLKPDQLTKDRYSKSCHHIRHSISNWNTTTSDCCKWDGITCNPLTGDVIGLDIACAGLQAHLFPNSSLFQLPRLQTLSLAFNRFHGSQLPLELTTFANSITHLNLSFCEFSGHPPFLPKLISLDLSGNQFQFNSSTIINLLQTPNLKELNLAWNNLSFYKPKFLNPSSALRLLNLQSTQLNGKWPYNIFNLQHLEHLDLSGNYFSGPWPKINTTIPLKWLDLGLNFLSGEIPKSIGHLKFLTSLSIFKCGLVGSLPKTIAKLRHLTYIDLSYNNLNGSIPFGLFSLPSLQTVQLHFNNFTGGLPPHLLSPSLYELNLNENELDIFLPSLQARQLHYLYMRSNKIWGPIPSSLCNLLQLQALDLSHNTLSGPIPTCLGDLSQIELLDLSRNQLTGEIPPSFEKLSHLVDLNLSQNHLEGCIQKGSALSRHGFFQESLGLKPCETVSPPSRAEGDRNEKKKKSEARTKIEKFVIGAVIGSTLWPVIGYTLIRLMLYTGRPKWFTDCFNAADRRFFNKQR